MLRMKWLVFLLLSICAYGQFQLINEQYTDVAIRDVDDDGNTSVAKRATLHLFQLNVDQDTYLPDTTFTVVSPSGEPLYNLLVNMPQPPARRYDRVLAGFRPKFQQLGLVEACEYTNFENPLESHLNISGNIQEFFPSVSIPPGSAALGILGAFAVVGISGLAGGALGGLTSGYCPQTFGICLCPIGTCIPDALDNLAMEIDKNRDLIEQLSDTTFALFGAQSEVNFQIYQATNAQQMAIEAGRDVSFQLDQSIRFMAGSIDSLIDAFYDQSAINGLTQAQLENLAGAQQQGLIATTILAQRTQEEIDEINAFILSLAGNTEAAFGAVVGLLDMQNAAIQESFNLTFDQIEQVDATMREVADRTNQELRILQNNVRALAEQLSGMAATIFQDQEMNIVRDAVNIALRLLVDGVDATTLTPFIADMGIPFTNVTDAPFNFTRFPIEQLSYLTAVDYLGNTWWYEITYNMFANPYYMMNAGSGAPNYIQLLQTLNANENLSGCNPGDNESTASNSGCTVWVERTLIRCIALNTYETLWEDRDNIIIDFDTMCNPATFDRNDFDNQLLIPGQYKVYVNATDFIRDLRYDGLGWSFPGSEFIAFMVPLANIDGGGVFPDGAVRATSRRAGSVADVHSFGQAYMFQPLEDMVAIYPRGNDPVSYAIRAWESAYTKTLADEIYRLRVGTKGTLPTGGVTTTWRPFSGRDPTTETARSCYRTGFASTSNSNAGTDQVHRFIPDSINIPLTLTKLYFNGTTEDVTNQFLDAVINFDDPLAAGVIPVEPAMAGSLDLQDGGIILDTPQSVMGFGISPRSRGYLYSIFPPQGQTPETFGFNEWAALNGAEFWDELSMAPTREFYERRLVQPLGATLPYDVVCSNMDEPNETALPNEWCIVLDNYIIRERQGIGFCDPAPCPDRYGPTAQMDCAGYCEMFEVVDFIPRQWSLTFQLSTEEDFNLIQQINSVCPDVEAIYETSTGSTSLLTQNNNPAAAVTARFTYITIPDFGCPGLLPTDFSLQAGGTRAFDFTPCLEFVDIVASISTLNGDICARMNFTSTQRNTYQETQLGTPAYYSTVKRSEVDAFNNATWDTLGSWAASTQIFLDQPILPPNLFAQLFSDLPPNAARDAALQKYNDLWATYGPLLENTTAALNFTIQSYQQNLNTSVSLLDSLIPYIQESSRLLNESRAIGEQAAIVDERLRQTVDNATYYQDNLDLSINLTADALNALDIAIYNSSVEVEQLLTLVVALAELIESEKQAFQDALAEAGVVTGAGWSTSSTSAFTIAIVALIISVASLAWTCVRSPPIKIPGITASAGRRSGTRRMDSGHHKRSAYVHDDSDYSDEKGALVIQ